MEPMIELGIGVAGMLLILAAFTLEEFAQHTRQESVAYNLLNLAGALLLVQYAWSLSSLPFLVLNGVWTVIAVVKLVMIGRRRSAKR